MNPADPIPLDPCGMEMDVLRSCYSTLMRFTPLGPAYPVKWYFCPPGALPFPGHHRFSSLNWEVDEIVRTDQGEVGEVPGAPRPYRKGERPRGVTGQQQCGPASWYFDGAPAAAPALPRRADGIATCCLPPGPGGLNLGRGAMVGSSTNPNAQPVGFYQTLPGGESTYLWGAPAGRVTATGVTLADYEGVIEPMSDLYPVGEALLRTARGARNEFTGTTTSTVSLYGNDVEPGFTTVMADLGAYLAGPYASINTLYTPAALYGPEQAGRIIPTALLQWFATGPGLPPVWGYCIHRLGVLLWAARFTNGPLFSPLGPGESATLLLLPELYFKAP